MSGKFKYFEKKGELKVLLQVFKYLIPYKPEIVMVIVCFIISTILVFFQPLIISRITDLGMIKQDLCIISSSVILLIFLIIFEQGIQLLQTYFFSRIYNAVYFDLAKSSFDKLLHLKLSYFMEKQSAEIIENIKTDVSNVASIVGQSIGVIISYIFRVISGIAGLFVISWKLTIIVLLIVPVKYLIIGVISRKLEKLTEKQIEYLSSFSSWFGDNINGIKEIKLWGLQKERFDVFADKQKEILGNSQKQVMLNAINIFIETILEWGIICVLYIVGGIQIINQNLTIGGVFAFVSYSSYVTGAMMIILNMKYMVASIIPSARRLFQFLELEEENELGDMIDEKDSKIIEYRNVKFAYSDKRDILKCVNLKINPRDKIAIIGSNGSGKSTFLNLLLRFLQPQEGSITIDGKKIDEIDLEAYRKLFAVVSQEPYLFSGTVKDNIILHKEIREEEYIDACRKSGVINYGNQHFIEDEKIIGKNGSKLSGGEKKKIAVARALVKNAPYIILDEATAGFDLESDRYWKRILEKELKEKTIIMITHSYHHLVNCDHIYRIDNGVINEISKADLTGNIE